MGKVELSRKHQQGFRYATRSDVFAAIPKDVKIVPSIIDWEAVPTGKATTTIARMNIFVEEIMYPWAGTYTGYGHGGTEISVEKAASAGFKSFLVMLFRLEFEESEPPSQTTVQHTPAPVQKPAHTKPAVVTAGIIRELERLRNKLYEKLPTLPPVIIPPITNDISYQAAITIGKLLRELEGIAGSEHTTLDFSSVKDTTELRAILEDMTDTN